MVLSDNCRYLNMVDTGITKASLLSSTAISKRLKIVVVLLRGIQFSKSIRTLMEWVPSLVDT